MDSGRPQRREFLNSMGRAAMGRITLRDLRAVASSPRPSAPARYRSGCSRPTGFNLPATTQINSDVLSLRGLVVA